MSEPYSFVVVFTEEVYLEEENALLDKAGDKWGDAETKLRDN